MKLLLVLDQFDEGNNGTTITARRLAEGLRKLGHEVSIVSTGECGEYKFAVKKFPLLPLSKKIVESQGMQFALPNKKILEEAVAWADAVHFIMPFLLSVQGLKTAQKLKKPHTAAFHVQPENITYSLGLGQQKIPNKLLYFWLRDSFFNNFRHIHCPSEFIAGQLREHGYNAKLHVISNGVQDDFTCRKIPKTPELKNKTLILMIGRLSNEKRQDVLIEAAKRSKHADTIQLVFAGKGPKKKAYEALGQTLKNKPLFDFYTHDRLLDLIAMSDLYVHTADAEIEAISCIEAFASGLVPVIANSSLSATPQFALDDRSLFEAGNAEALAAKIDYWLDNADERRKMEKTYAEHGKKFAHASCVQKMIAMFEEEIADYKRLVQ